MSYQCCLWENSQELLRNPEDGQMFHYLHVMAYQEFLGFPGKLRLQELTGESQYQMHFPDRFLVFANPVVPGKSWRFLW